MPETRRTNPGFLSDNEASRDRKRTQDFVRSLADYNKDVFSFANRLCDSCGVPLQSDSWFCKKCNICFCYKCGKDFSQIQENIFPNCPMCDERLVSGKGQKSIHDKQKVLRYVSSTKLEFQNEEELIGKVAQLFNQDVSYVRHVWSIVKAENPRALSDVKCRFKNQQDKSFRPFDDSLLEYSPKTHTYNVPNIIKPKSEDEVEKTNLKDLKPIDGSETEWKEGKMQPAEQKKYRSSFEE
ncbi:MAG: hypothetical protein ABSD42_06740 [Candidatus Bathyarchaeia archaeon]|jgi:predicted  nucleic acid-binding Zn-ribbon protein